MKAEYNEYLAKSGKPLEDADEELRSKQYT